MADDEARRNVSVRRERKKGKERCDRIIAEFLSVCRRRSRESICRLIASSVGQLVEARSNSLPFKRVSSRPRLSSSSISIYSSFFFLFFIQKISFPSCARSDSARFEKIVNVIRFEESRLHSSRLIASYSSNSLCWLRESRY